MSKPKLERPKEDLVLVGTISQIFTELAGKHKVKIDDLNLHIHCKTLYIQEYTPNCKNEYKCLDMINLM